MSETCVTERMGKSAFRLRKYVVDWCSIGDGIDAGAAAMFVRHWEEVEIDKGEDDFQVDWPRLFELETLGYSKSFGLWWGDRLVGYSLFHVTPNIHSRHVIQGVNDVLFVEREHRGHAGVLLIRKAERLLAGIGVKWIMYNTKVGAKVGRRGNTTGDLLARMGYRLDELVYTKMLGEK